MQDRERQHGIRERDEREMGETLERERGRIEMGEGEREERTKSRQGDIIHFMESCFSRARNFLLRMCETSFHAHVRDREEEMARRR